MSDRLTVLQQFPVPRRTTNPYLVMLADHLRDEPNVAVLNFSWRTAFSSAYDVFHIHWPEILVNGNGPLKRFIRQMLTVLLLVRLSITKTAIVRTVHNVELPEGLSRWQRFLLRRIDRRTAHRITLNTSTELPAAWPSTLIPHGHYREWFERYPKAPPIEGRVGYFGLIRRYKGVEALVESFGSAVTASPELSLRIGGKPSTDELAATITSLAKDDPRIHLDLHFLDDEELVDIATSSDLVVLPYRFMHNSGSSLAALSLGRPVLVPDNDVNRRLAEEVGPGWVQRFTGELDPETLRTAVARVRATPRAEPRFIDRDWTLSAQRHVNAYRAAVSAVRRSRSSNGPVAAVAGGSSAVGGAS